MDGSRQPKTNDLIGDLVVAILSVNAWPLEKTFKIYESLRAQGLFDVQRIAKMAPAEVFDRLKNAGYARGDFMVGLLADRLLNMACALDGDAKAKLEQLVANRDVRSLEAFLLQLKGVGPAVVQSFKLLRGVES